MLVHLINCKQCNCNEGCSFFNWDQFHHKWKHYLLKKNRERGKRKITSFSLLGFQIQILHILLFSQKKHSFDSGALLRIITSLIISSVDVWLLICMYFNMQLLKKDIKLFSSCFRLKNLMIFFWRVCHTKLSPTAIFVRSSKMVINVLSVTYMRCMESLWKSF